MSKRAIKLRSFATSLLTCTLLQPVLVYAAKPTSIIFESGGLNKEGVDYGNYRVKCSDNRRPAITAWDKKKKWCLGEASQENCHKRQIKAAIAACK
jgi:hypothetical protein